MAKGKPIWPVVAAKELQDKRKAEEASPDGTDRALPSPEEANPQNTTRYQLPVRKRRNELNGT
ncbi:unnamed protein product [Penicillium viridicatum]